MSNDKPQINLTFSKLDAEIDAPSPFVYTTKASKRVTFPDLYAMEASEGEQVMKDMRTKTDSAFLQQWLSDDDHAALMEDKLTFRHRRFMMKQVIAYYEASMGDEGEETASES